MDKHGSKFLEWYECELGKFDPLLLWASMLEESGGEINGLIAKIGQLLSIDDLSGEQELELVQLVTRCGQIAKHAFACQLSDASVLEGRPMYYFYNLLVDFINWFSKKD